MKIMSGLSTPNLILLIFFAVGYVAIIFEFWIKVNKSAVALLTAVVCWTIYFIADPQPLQTSLSFLSVKLSMVSQILFFLLGAMTLVELIDSHKGFNTVVEQLHTRSQKKMLILITVIAFFLSAILDNFTTTILMITLLRKLVTHRKERFYLACMIVVAANAGGAWTPIGDVTTTMLWINGQISTLNVIKHVFFPSFVSILIPFLYFSRKMKGNFTGEERLSKKEELEPGAHLVFGLGIGAFLFVPIFKWLTGMPPFMGMIIALAILWVITDLMHHKHEKRQHLRVTTILTKIDVSTIMFFLGILLTVEALEATHMLSDLATFAKTYIKSDALLATVLGFLSSIIDNVPLVAASIGMYSLENYPLDSSLWMMIAYAAGTGGSMLIIGSSAGVALMGMERIDFVTYLKKASFPIFLGFLLGMLIYVLF